MLTRRALHGEIALQYIDDRQQVFGFKAAKRIRGYKYAVPVTNSEHEVLAIEPLYRHRANAENSFDGLKNQWDWSGFATHDLLRYQLSTRAVALIYNWQSLCVAMGKLEGAPRNDHESPAIDDVGWATQRAHGTDDVYADRACTPNSETPATRSRAFRARSKSWCKKLRSNWNPSRSGAASISSHTLL